MTTTYLQVANRHHQKIVSHDDQLSQAKEKTHGSPNT